MSLFIGISCKRKDLYTFHFITKMSIQQGQSIANAIDVEKVASSSLDIVYGREWQQIITGQQLMRMRFPKVLVKGIVKIIPEKPTMFQKDSVIYCRDIPNLEMIPPITTIDEARVKLEAEAENINPWGIHISNVGYISADALTFLPRIFETKNFVCNLQALISWIKGRVSKLDNEFAPYFEDILLNEPGIMRHNFSPLTTNHIKVSTHSICHLAHEHFIDDDIVRGIMELFTEYYGADGKHLFIPPLVLEAWRTSEVCVEWRWGREQIRRGNVKKVFVIVAMIQHWGAFYVNITNKKIQIQFGDSLGLDPPNDALRAIIRWLKLAGKKTSNWNGICDKFDVPEQPDTSGSCAINAANTIERVVNPTVERWTHSRSAYHRLRFLKLLTGYSKVSI